MITHKNLFVNTHFLVSRLPSHYDRRYTTYPLEVILKEIQSGNGTIPDTADRIRDKTLRGITKEARRVLALNNPASEAAYQEIKKSMPAISPAGVLSSEGHIQAFSGLAYLDYDNPSDSAYALSVAAANPHTLAAFRSLRGNRIKVLSHLAPNASDTGLSLNAATYKHAWLTAVLAYEEIGLPDPNGATPTALSALVYDPDLFVNLNAIPLQWSVDEDAFNEYFPKSESETEISALSGLPPEYHDAIREMEWKEDCWGKTQLPCIFVNHENDGWGLRTNAMGVRRNGENDYTFSCRKCNGSRRYTDQRQENHPLPPRQEIVARDAEATRRAIENAPPVEVRETPSFPHFSKEERVVVDHVLGISPDAGWNDHIPIFTTRYEHLHPLTDNFALNGQPSEVKKHRVWCTLFGTCPICSAITAKWVDRYQLKAGRYCDGCHKDFHLGSYLELELARKLPNSTVSDYHGFLGDDPDFLDFRLWEPSMLTHLGAGMSTGKSTEIYKAMIHLAMQGLGKGIIAVPRVSLARSLVHYLRRRDGFKSWGLWHGGVRCDELFIGEFGAIVCFPSLSRAVAYASDAGVKRLYIAIDELDFAYNLLSLTVEQTTAVKKCLRDALVETGLVVSGQTESTLALEAFAEELEADQIQAYYNTAEPSEGHVTLFKYADEKGKSTSILAGSIENISDALKDGHNVYVFCASRRDGDVIAECFADEYPVLYNAYTKGNARADAVLRNQRLTDSKLFIGTSAAGVGISILDPKARTVIVSGLTYGSRDPNMNAQESVRDRGRRGVAIHYTDYKFALPLKPSEAQDVSLYHEALKQASNQHSHLSEAGIKKIAHAQALTSLADAQFETFIGYHLGVVGNMPVYQASALSKAPAELQRLSEIRKTLRRDEREKKLNAAVDMLDNRDLLTSSEIRVCSNKGQMCASLRIAYKSANGFARAVGWNDKVDRTTGNPFADILDEMDIAAAVALAENNIDVERLAKQRRGYLACKLSKMD